ncbi:MAG TPA: hypothetical protein VNU01_02390 [Egibacteraceae bacterium]|nr:hypothetical protein [Egibacteraceae bacterium]
MRAPRLGPDQRIAAHVTRVGRFRRIDPSKGRRGPSRWALLGRLGWAVLVAESLRRAWRRSATGDSAAGDSAASGPG